ncbi:MAG: Flp pilus assembly protein CpaB [Verrucomicrobiae bacterium]|nr:Flp pilus assembly protein CpaB [Verrucomicrobiae bacterium]MDW8343218.1 Flp pilus assembly protein CpaB [Verrucomicrobiae bacterium]
MPSRHGAGGVLVVAVLLGLVTAYFTWNYIKSVQGSSKENWVDVVVAAQDIAARSEVTRDHITITRFPKEHVAPDACTKIEDVVGRIALERIRAKDQVRASSLARRGEAPGITYSIPPGKRAIAIGVDEVKGVGTMIKPGDRVDIIATLTDPLARMETTQTILQNLPVLAVDKGRTEAKEGGGASSSITIAVAPEDAERLTAADRLGTLRVMLRPAEEDVIVATEGVRATQVFPGRLTPTIWTNEQAATPVIISPPPSSGRRELRVYRGSKEQVVPAE